MAIFHSIAANFNDPPSTRIEFRDENRKLSTFGISVQKGVTKFLISYEDSDGNITNLSETVEPNHFKLSLFRELHKWTFEMMSLHGIYEERNP